jgi:hypothetical protein
MVKPSYLDELTRRARRVEFSDGLTDLQTALTFFLLGFVNAAFLSQTGMEWYVRAILANRELTLLGLLGLFAVFLLILFGSRRVVRWVRSEKLNSGGGRVTPLAWQLDRWVAFLALGAFLLIFIPGMVLFPRKPLDMHSGLRITIAGGSAATAVIYFAMGRILTVKRYMWVALAGFAGALLLMVIPFSAAESWIVFTFVWTVSLGISGGLALRRTLLQRSEETDG